MKKGKSVDLFISDSKVYYDFFSGTRVKFFCRCVNDSTARVYDVPIRKLRILDTGKYNAIAYSRFGFLKYFCLHPIVFDSIRYERRK